jgi:UDP-N-acetylmuramyl tripeptide synthase
VIAGKGADSAMEIGGALVPFDDRTVARELLTGADSERT